MSNILVIAPHPDDEIIGCGGTLLEHVSNGDEVNLFFLTNGEYCLEEEVYIQNCKIREKETYFVSKEANFKIQYFSNFPSRSILSNYDALLKLIVKSLKKLKPSVIYFPHSDEKDNDHCIANKLLKDAYIVYINDKCEVYAKLICYEVWTPIIDVLMVNDITKYISLKKKLIKYYKSQNHIDYANASLALNRFRSCINGGRGFAEGFTYETF